MVDINPTTSIITLNVNGLMHQLKDRDCQSGLKNKAQLYAVYKKLTLNTDTYAKSKRMEKNILRYTNQRKVRVAILISNRASSEQENL